MCMVRILRTEIGKSSFCTPLEITIIICEHAARGGKGKGSSLYTAPLTILDSGALQARKWQLTGIDCSIPTAAPAIGCP